MEVKRVIAFIRVELGLYSILTHETWMLSHLWIDHRSE